MTPSCFCCERRGIYDSWCERDCLPLYCTRCLNCELHCTCTPADFLADLLKEPRERFLEARAARRHAKARARWRARLRSLEEPWPEGGPVAQAPTRSAPAVHGEEPNLEYNERTPPTKEDPA